MNDCRWDGHEYTECAGKTRCLCEREVPAKEFFKFLEMNDFWGLKQMTAESSPPVFHKNVLKGFADENLMLFFKKEYHHASGGRRFSLFIDVGMFEEASNNDHIEIYRKKQHMKLGYEGHPEFFQEILSFIDGWTWTWRD